MRPVGKTILMASISLVLLLSTGIPSAWAAESGEGSAYGAYVDLTFTPSLPGPDVTTEAGPLPTVSGNAPPDFDEFDYLASFTVIEPSSGTSLSVTELDVATISDLAGEDVSSQSTAATVDLIIPGPIPGFPLLQLSIVEGVQSNAQVSGPCPTLVPTGSTSIISGTLSGSLVDTPINIQVSPPANDELFNFMGIRIVLNEQELYTNANEAALTVNAVHMYLDNIAFPTGSLNGDVVISQSMASLTCGSQSIPTLSEVGMIAFVLILMIAGIFFVRRRSY